MSEELFDLNKTEYHILYNFLFNNICMEEKKVIEYLKLENKTHEELKKCIGDEEYNKVTESIKNIDKNKLEHCFRCARFGIGKESNQKCQKCEANLCDSHIDDHECENHNAYSFMYPRKYLLVNSYQKLSDESFEVNISVCLPSDKFTHLNMYSINRDKLPIVFNQFITEFENKEDYSFQQFVWDRVFTEENEGLLKNICNARFLKADDFGMEGFLFFLESLANIKNTDEEILRWIICCIHETFCQICNGL